MSSELMSTILDVASTLLITLITVFGAWLTIKLNKSASLKNINSAKTEVINMAIQTVGELKQTITDDLKSSNPDGKLTAAQITQIKQDLLTKVESKISTVAVTILNAASIDITSIITGAAENYLSQLNSSTNTMETTTTE